jgi:CheY-like chemotaxis protein
MIVPTPEAHSKKSNGGLSNGSPPNPGILVVDDNPANLRAFESILETLPVRVLLANSGQEALRLLLKEEFAVILLDMRMPVMDGLETASVIRQGGKAQYTPIIFVSAYDQTPREVSEGYLAGAIDYLFSPVNPETLKRKVGAFVELYLRNREVRLLSQRLAEENALQKESIRELEGTLQKMKEDLTRASGQPAY